jgi:phage terminase large subunit-like protein
MRCKYEPLGADADTMDGLNVHAAIIDELHMHKTPDVWNVLETATAARRQPLLFGITTAGFDRNSICWHLHDYGAKVLDGTIEDDSFFAYICTLDESDDWTNADLWIKSNPNLNVTVKLDDLSRKFKKARESAVFENEFKRLHLNVWTQQHTKWLNMEEWDACAGVVDPAAMEGKGCYGGLDLAPKRDLSALVLLFKTEGIYKVVPYFWMPADNVKERERRDRLPYSRWIRDGLIRTTEGNVTDYSVIRKQIKEEIAKRFSIREIAFDPYGATEMVSKLIARGLKMVEFRQTIQNFNEPTQKLEALVKSKHIHHGGHPILRAHAEAVTVKTDVNENLRPVKDTSTGRIDGIVALIMALSRGMRHETFKSVYSMRGPIWI